MGLAAVGTVATVAAAGAGLAGSAMQAGATRDASSKAQGMLSQQRNDLAPYRDAGLPTLQAQQDLLGLNGQDAATAAMANFQQSPGYQFQLQQGLRAVDAGAAARGMLRSGATLKGEETFGQGLANQDFTNYYNRLMGLSTLGANAAAGGAQTASTAAQLGQQAGNTQASIYGDASRGLGNSVNALLNNKQFQDWINTPATPPAGNLSSYAPNAGSYQFAEGFGFGGY